jgi:hypothetical protein
MKSYSQAGREAHAGLLCLQQQQRNIDNSSVGWHRSQAAPQLIIQVV